MKSSQIEHLTLRILFFRLEAKGRHTVHAIGMAVQFLILCSAFAIVILSLKFVWSVPAFSWQTPLEKLLHFVK